MYICRTVDRLSNRRWTRRTLLQTVLPTAYLSGSAYAMFIYTILKMIIALISLRLS